MLRSANPVCDAFKTIYQLNCSSGYSGKKWLLGCPNGQGNPAAAGGFGIRCTSKSCWLRVGLYRKRDVKSNLQDVYVVSRRTYIYIFYKFSVFLPLLFLSSAPVSHPPLRLGRRPNRGHVGGTYSHADVCFSRQKEQTIKSSSGIEETQSEKTARPAVAQCGRQHACGGGSRAGSAGGAHSRGRLFSRFHPKGDKDKHLHV